LQQNDTDANDDASWSLAPTKQRPLRVVDDDHAPLVSIYITCLRMRRVDVTVNAAAFR
jgi:hypothetical protein